MSKKTEPPEQRIEAIGYGLALIKSGVKPKAAWGKAGEKFNVSVGALYRWYAMVRGKPRKKWLELLKPKHKGRTAKASFSEVAWEYFLKVYNKDYPPSITAAYEKTLIAAAAKNWDVPSLRTIQRRLKLEAVSTRNVSDIDEAVWQCFLKAYDKTLPPSFPAAYRATAEIAKEKNWVMPSIDAFNLLFKRKGLSLRTIYDDDLRDIKPPLSGR